MYFLFTLIFFTPYFLASMEIPLTSEEKFLKYVLAVTHQDRFDILEKHLTENNWLFGRKEEREERKKQYDTLQQEKETYEQFIRWQNNRSATLKLCDLKFLFCKMAEENCIEGMQAVEALALEWKLISHPEEKLEKLDYPNALTQAVTNGMADATEYVLHKKNISLKNNKKLIAQVCWGKWGTSKYHGFKETQQKRIVQLMIKKGANSDIQSINSYLTIARDSKAPEQLIQYLEKVATSRSVGKRQ